MLVQDSEIGGKGGKRNRGLKIKVRGAAAAATTRRPRGGAKCLVPDAKGLRLKVYGPQANNKVNIMQACWCRTVKLGEREGKEIEGRKIKVRGAAAAATTRRQEEGPNVFVPDAKGLRLKVYGLQANRTKAGSQRPVVGDSAQ